MARDRSIPSSTRRAPAGRCWKAPGRRYFRRNWWYPRAWLESDGEVFLFGARPNIDRGVYRMDPSGDGRIRQVGELPFDHDTALPAILYRTDRVLAMDQDGDLWDINIGGATPTFARAGSMGQMRDWSNMVLLADGTVMISGGSGVRNELVDVTREVAFWNPDTRR